MNIWSISKYASIPKYGAAARLFFLTKEFIALGHNATLITSDANHFSVFPITSERYNYEKVEGVPLYWIKTKKYNRTASISRVLSWIDFERWLFLFDKSKLKKPDVVIVSSLSLLSILYGFYLKKLYKAFLVFEVRDIWPLTMTEEGGFSKWHPLVLLLGVIEKFGYKNSDLIVGTMPRLGMHVKEILGYEKSFFCSPLGFNKNNYNDKARISRMNFEALFPKDKIIIGYAGSMGISNALEPFIECIKLLENNTNIYFVLVGGGDLADKFEDQLSDSNNVKFLQKIPQDEVKHFLAQCDILYLSTQDSKVWTYGQSMNKIVEYMLAGKPVLASYSGYQTMLNEAGAGIYILNSTAKELKNVFLKYVLLSPKERKQIGENGKCWIEKNRTYSILAKNYINEIKLLMQD
jgi:glycosyltransferase involved in cell wall biosynthesis